MNTRMTVSIIAIVAFFLMIVAGLVLMSWPNLAWNILQINYIPTYNFVGQNVIHNSYWQYDVVYLGRLIFLYSFLFLIVPYVVKPKNFMQQWREVSENQWDLSAQAFNSVEIKLEERLK